MKAIDADKELQDLLIEFLDGNLSTDDRHKLNERLKGDPEAQQLYLALCETHAALAWEHGMMIADLTPSQLDSQTTNGSSPFRLIASVISLAAMVLIGLFVGYTLLSPNPMLNAPVVAQITSRIDASLKTGDDLWESNELRIGVYEIEQGFIQFEYESGVTVLVEAPARFEALSSDKLVLHSGRLSANVPPEGIGFTVETPEAKVIDFGTEFGVEVNNGESEIHVFEGHVRVQNKAELENMEEATVDLTTAQAVRVGESTGKPANIDLATDRFVRTIEEPQLSYPNSVIQLSPIAYYRMPLRTQGLACTNPEFSGELLTGKGTKAVWGPGFIGSSLRVGGRSIGRGGLVQPAPSLVSGQLTILAWVRADARASEATIITDGSMKHGEGSFSLSLDNETGLLKAIARSESGELVSCKDTEIIPLSTWIHVAVTVDGNQLKLFRDGTLACSADCSLLSNIPSPSLSIGTKPSGRKRWEGRIDEVALFDKALGTEEIRELYKIAVQQESELLSERIKRK